MQWVNRRWRIDVECGDSMPEADLKAPHVDSTEDPADIVESAKVILLIINDFHIARSDCSMEQHDKTNR